MADMAEMAERQRDTFGRFVRRDPLIPEHPALPSDPVLAAPELYINRELSVLDFQWRVFEEAQDDTNPLLERVQSIAYVSTNVDEFFMIRAAGVKQQIDTRTTTVVGRDGMTPRETLHAIHANANALLTTQGAYLEDTLLPMLAAHDVHVCAYHDLDNAQCAAADQYFMREVFPVLTPLAVDSGHPFPHISNRSLNLLVVVRDAAGEHIARVKIPQSLPRFVIVPPTATMQEHAGIHRARASVWLEQVIIANLGTLFAGTEIVAAYPFHVTRNADIEIQELEAEDLLQTIAQGLEQRQFGSVVRLMVDDTMPETLVQWLTTKLELTASDVYTMRGPLGIGDVMQLTKVDRPDLKYPSFVPGTPAALRDGVSIYAAIAGGDILVHHPYDSFNPVVDFIQAGSADPNVRAIKQTLYRAGSDSPIVEALANARDEETQVAVLVELKARFDEENNIVWARALERRGVHVAYGMPGLKVHCKAALVVRREADSVRRYVHLGTGNYNAGTARGYTDLGLFTANEEIGADVSDLFNFLTGYSNQQEYRKLLVAPVSMRRRAFEMIERECALGERGRLLFKTNHLVDEEMIEELYRASQLGVKIDLICRQTCCLRPGIPGISENIRVISIVGRFLEHSRVYLFGNGGETEIYVGSADLMTRNLDRRVEILFPIEDASLRKHIERDILDVALRDTAKARELHADGTWHRVRPTAGEEPFNSQEYLLSTHTERPQPHSPRQ